MESNEVAIVGGGLAGLSLALHLESEGVAVSVYERSTYPHHKVCGEYVSHEVVPYLKDLGVDFTTLDTVPLERLKLTLPDGKCLTSNLPLGGFGLSRYDFDYALYRQVLERGIELKRSTVASVTPMEGGYLLKTREGDERHFRLVVGAYGKRTSLDRVSERPFIARDSPWTAVKAHFEDPHFPRGLVELHPFPGGYAGLSRTSGGLVNLCGLVHRSVLEPVGGADPVGWSAMRGNPELAAFLERARLVFDRPLAIAQIAFGAKGVSDDRMLYCGDSAGLIHPLCGNGMAMAIRSAKLLGTRIPGHITGKYDRRKLEVAYLRDWRSDFALRMRVARGLQFLLSDSRWSAAAWPIFANGPRTVRKVIEMTHGKPFGK